MRSMVRAMRLKPTAKNTVGGTNSWNSLITNARRRDLDMNGFLGTRGRMPETQLELINPTPKVLRYFHGRQFIFGLIRTVLKIPSGSSQLTFCAKLLFSLQRAGERFGRDVHAVRGEGLGGHG